MSTASLLTHSRSCVVRDLGRMGYAEALDIQTALAEERKQGAGTDHVLFVEHPHVVTIGRNGHGDNVLVTPEFMRKNGIELFETNRGGDVTYHGPGQIVMYPVMRLSDWKRDVGEFLRALEQVLIDTLGEFGIAGERIPKLTGVWTGGAKIAAMGVHLSRWVSTHGVALNVTTDLRYFGYIVPCGLTQPVTSMEQQGVRAEMADVKASMARHFGKLFDFEMSMGEI